MNEWLGALGIPGSLAAAVWLTYGGYLLRDRIGRGNGKPNGHDARLAEMIAVHMDGRIGPRFDALRKEIVEEVRRQSEATADCVRDGLTIAMLKSQQLRGSRDG